MKLLCKYFKIGNKYTMGQTKHVLDIRRNWLCFFIRSFARILILNMVFNICLITLLESKTISISSILRFLQFTYISMLQSVGLSFVVH